MSTVCGCTCEGGQVWVHARRRGVGGGRIRPAGGSGSIDIAPLVTPSKPVKSTNGRFYWANRDVSLFFARLCPPDFSYTNFSGDRGCPHFTYTDFFSWRYRRSLATHTFSGCRHRRICILTTQTFRVAGVLHFTHTHTHTFRGDF